jgi:hypothetical protein
LTSSVHAQLKASAAKKARGKFKELAEDWYETEIKGGRLKHPAQTPGGATPVSRQIHAS